MKTLLPVIALVVICLHANGEKIKGTIISKGTSREMTFIIRQTGFGEPRFEPLQYEINYIDEKGEKQILKPEDADEIRFIHAGIVMRMISVENTISAGNKDHPSEETARIFLRLEVDGALKLYRYYYKVRYHPSGNPAEGSFSPGGTSTQDEEIFQKGSDPLFRPKSRWRDTVAEYLSDCPEIAKQITDRKIGRQHSAKFVRDYNRDCAKSTDN